jgi:glycerol-3-phosphate cytidylyltransferase-like family protein
LDTRQKIVDGAMVPRAEGLFVSGYFDPLLAAHAKRLRELREGHGGLAVIILDPERPILPARARAELVAALECVDYVVIGASERAVCHEEQAHAAMLDRLVAQVARRHGR